MSLIQSQLAEPFMARDPVKAASFDRSYVTFRFEVDCEEFTDLATWSLGSENLTMYCCRAMSDCRYAIDGTAGRRGICGMVHSGSSGQRYTQNLPFRNCGRARTIAPGSSHTPLRQQREMLKSCSDRE